MNRRGEEGATPFRTGRFFTIGHNWYVATRENRNLGPFPSLDRARAGLAQYLASLAVSDLQTETTSLATASRVSETMVSEFSVFLERLNAVGHAAAIAWANGRQRELEEYPYSPEEKRERLTAISVILQQF